MIIGVWVRDMRSDQQLCSLKNNETLDHVNLPPKRRDKSNFLHDKLEGKIYMENPNGYIDSLLTCKMRYPLYGIKQGPIAWHLKFNPFILSKRFERCNISYKRNNIYSPICHQIGRRWRVSHA